MFLTQWCGGTHLQYQHLSTSSSQTSEFKVSLAHKGNSRTARAKPRNPALKQNKKATATENTHGFLLTGLTHAQ